MKEITKINFEGYKYVEGGVCAAAGFKANGLYCGIKKEDALENGEHKNDLGLVFSERVCNTAAVYTQNKVKGAPVLVTKENLAKTGGKAQAVIVNSKNANTCNADGEQKAFEMCRLAAEQLGIDSRQVVVASTGVIGQVLPIEPISGSIKQLAEGLAYDGNEKAAYAIMTTDTVKKEIAVEFEVGGKICRVGGMAKGSGMIHPNMATTLNFITTDCNVSVEMLQKILDENVKVTYNCLSIDGDQSTNDMLVVMANGMAQNKEIVEEDEDFKALKKAIYIVMMNMTKMLAKDGEGATKLLECTVSGAKDWETAEAAAKSVVCSSLFKAAMFGQDANWGRILCALGYAQADFDISKTDVSIFSKKGRINVCKNGAGVEFSEEEAKKILKEDEIYIEVSVGDGEAKATAWGCDLTYDYVRINGDYRS